jgi:hypothetical protein
MALTIAVCIGGFAWIYAKANPYFTDFIGADATSTPRVTTVSGGEAGDPTEEPAPEPTETSEPDEEAQETPTSEPSPTSDQFTQTHVSNPDLSTNLRPEPSTSGDPVAVLAPGTPLQYLDEQQTGDDGFQWYRFRTEDGLEGWLREGVFVEAT